MIIFQTFLLKGHEMLLIVAEMFFCQKSGCKKDISFFVIETAYIPLTLTAFHLQIPKNCHSVCHSDVFGDIEDFEWLKLHLDFLQYEFLFHPLIFPYLFHFLLFWIFFCKHGETFMAYLLYFEIGFIHVV